MTAQVIPVRTTGPAQTQWTDSTAAVHQDLMEYNVKEVIVTDNVTTQIFCMSNITTMSTSDWKQTRSGVFSSEWLLLEKGKRRHLVFDYYDPEETKGELLGNLYLFSLQRKCFDSFFPVYNLKQI